MLLGPELYFPFGVFDSLTNDFQGEAKRSLDRADTYNLFLVARLRDGVSREGAAEAMKALGASLEQAFPVEHKNQAFAIAELPRLGSSTSPSQFGHAIGSPGRSTRAGTLNGAPRPALVAPRALQTHATPRCAR